MGFRADSAKATRAARPVERAGDLWQTRFFPGNQHPLSKLAETTDSLERIAKSTLPKQYQDTFHGTRYLPASAIKCAAATGRVTMVVHRGMTRIPRRSCPLRKDPGLVAPTRIQDCKGELQVSSPAASFVCSFPTRRSCLVRKFARVSLHRRQSPPQGLEIVWQIFGSPRTGPARSRHPAFGQR